MLGIQHDDFILVIFIIFIITARSRALVCESGLDERTEHRYVILSVSPGHKMAEKSIICSGLEKGFIGKKTGTIIINRSGKKNVRKI